MIYGRGFGFRGASPAWPYVGRGRGGLPRCMSPGLAPQGYVPYGGYGAWGQPPYRQQSNPGDELNFLREESGALKSRLEEIDARISELESKEN